MYFIAHLTTRTMTTQHEEDKELVTFDMLMDVWEKNKDRIIKEINEEEEEEEEEEDQCEVCDTKTKTTIKTYGCMDMSVCKNCEEEEEVYEICEKCHIRLGTYDGTKKSYWVMKVDWFGKTMCGKCALGKAERKERK